MFPLGKFYVLSPPIDLTHRYECVQGTVAAFEKYSIKSLCRKGVVCINNNYSSRDRNIKTLEQGFNLVLQLCLQQSCQIVIQPGEIMIYYDVTDETC